MNRRHFLQHLSLTPLAAGLAQSAPATKPPNIVLIYADDVGYGDLSCYGATNVKTPNLDKLAGGGLRFTNAHAPSATCTPSRYALLSGEYAWRRKDTGILPGDAPLLFKPGRPTLPSLLQQRGYRTAAVGKWHLGLGDGQAPIDWNKDVKPGPLEIGFDYCFLMPATGDRVPCVYFENHRVVNLDPQDPIQVSYEKPFANEPTGKANPELLKMKPSHGHDQAIVNGVSRIGYMTGGKKALWVDETIADTLTAKATAFIEREKAKPFFLYFATHDIHVPRMPNNRFVGKTGMGPRGDAIAELDWTVGQVLETLDRLKLTDNTIMMFSSDNGPVIDDGYQDQAVEKLNGHRAAGIYRGGKYSAFDGGTRVPFLLRWPGQVKPDSTSNVLLSHVDLLASLTSIAGTPKLPEDAAPDSFNLAQSWLGKSQTGRPYLIEHANTLALIKDDWKYIQPGKGQKINKPTNTETGNDPQPQLYNLKDDPGEQHNLAEAEPARVKELAALLEKAKSEGRTRP